MDINALLHPRIKDHESLQEFVDDFIDQVPNIERDVARLKGSPYDKAVIANLFRALHNIKGDAALCKVDLGGIIAHPIETLLGRVKNRKFKRTSQFIFGDHGPSQSHFHLRIPEKIFASSFACMKWQ